MGWDQIGWDWTREIDPFLGLTAPPLLFFLCTVAEVGMSWKSSGPDGFGRDGIRQDGMMKSHALECHQSGRLAVLG